MESISICACSSCSLRINFSYSALSRSASISFTCCSAILASFSFASSSIFWVRNSCSLPCPATEFSRSALAAVASLKAVSLASRVSFRALRSASNLLSRCCVASVLSLRLSFIAAIASPRSLTVSVSSAFLPCSASASSVFSASRAFRAAISVCSSSCKALLSFRLLLMPDSIACNVSLISRASSFSLTFSSSDPFRAMCFSSRRPSAAARESCRSDTTSFARSASETAEAELRRRPSSSAVCASSFAS